jgi:Protein of unknown function (DUF3703)
VTMHRVLAEAIEAEFGDARRMLAEGDATGAFSRLERAHVLGQKSTRAHVRAHWAMLMHARRFGSARDVAGQVGRLLGATLFTWLWVPEGNTGGTNVGAFDRMPIPPELQRLISPGERDSRS